MLVEGQVGHCWQQGHSQIYDAVSAGNTASTPQTWASGSGPAASTYREASVGFLLLLKEGSVGTHFIYTRCYASVCFCSGKSNPYCEISMGSQSYTTRTLQDTLNPKWNFNCQFFIKDLHQDVLCLTMFDRDQFSPDGKV